MDLRAAAIAWLTLVTIGCADRTSSPTAPVVSSSPAAPVIASSVAPSRSSEPCVASVTEWPPEQGWRKTATIIVKENESGARTVELQDDKGVMLVPPKPYPKGLAGVPMISELVCRGGGLMVVKRGKVIAPGTTSLDVIGPVAPSEQGDVALLCKPPETLSKANLEGLTPDQKARFYVPLYLDRLTSSRWRAWADNAFNAKLLTDPLTTPEALRGLADELSAAAQPLGIRDCWLVNEHRASAERLAKARASRRDPQ